MTQPDPDFLCGYELLQRLIRGDAVAGLIADVPATERTMLDALWAAARRGDADAYAALGDCYFSALRPLGALDGVDVADAERHAWADDAAAIVDEGDALQAALRCYFQASRLGKRQATSQFAQLARHAGEPTRRAALAELERLADPTPPELYQRGLVQHWLGELEASAKSHVAAAEAGSLDAKFELHLYFAQGLGVQADAASAQAWLERAAEGGHGRALYNMGAAWASGQRGEPDMKKAASYYERAADAGNGRAAAMLAVMVLGGDIEGAGAQAIERLDQADELGFPSWELLDAVGLDDPREATPDDREEDG